MKANISIAEKGFLVERYGLSHHPWILGVQGSPYEMGLQHGYLLAKIIEKTASGFLSPIYAQFGGWQPEKGGPPSIVQMQAGRELLFQAYKTWFEPRLQRQAPEFLQEMNGIADGLAQAGSEVPREDILIGNCIPEITELQFYLPESEPDADSPATPSKGCSDCIAWGGATADGRLVHGSNYDYSTFNVLHKGMGVVIAKPQSGYAFMAQCLPGTIGHYRGMNVQCITTGEPTSDSADRNLRAHARITHAMHMRKIIQYASSIDDAIAIMQQLKGTTGYNHSIADAKVPTAVDIEASCNQMGIIYPQPETDALWSTNQFVAYPGFKGYEGENLVKEQMRWWQIPWDQADTIEKWKKAVRAETDKRTFSWQRYEKMEELLGKNYGRIDVNTMIRILGTYPLSRPPGDKTQLSASCEQLYGIGGPILDQRLASVFSIVFDPCNFTAWVATGAEPAQAGPYWSVALFDYLNILERCALEKGASALEKQTSAFEELIPICHQHQDHNKDGSP
jgi:hypothetical protein